MQKEPTLRFGIVGIGSGARGLLRAFEKHPNIKITAATDVRADALDKFAGEYGAETFSSVEDMCHSPNVDAVWVATPNHFHAEHVITAADHKKHVIVSKPMAITLDQCKEMISAADRNGVKLLAGHTQSIVLGLRKMAEVVRSGELGKLAMVHSWNFTPWLYRPRMPEELDASKGGGVVFRQSPHHIDMVRLIAGGMVRSVRAMTLQLDPARPVPGAFTAYLEFEDGTPATIVYSGLGHFDSADLTFGMGGFSPGTRAEALVSSGMSSEQEQALKEARRYTAGSEQQITPAARTEDAGLSPFGFTLACCERGDIRQSPRGLIIYEELGKQREVELTGGEPRGYPELDEMYQAVVHDRPIVHDGRWGLATQEVTMAIIQSAQERREIMMVHQVAVPQ